MGCLNSKGGGNKGNDGATNGGDSKQTLANTGGGKAYVKADSYWSNSLAATLILR